ncbi:hypothetical protein GCM10023183_35130 [Nibribacter koreensis]|uniref:Uncharacterized protein n=1 Tax=Nibribacter koreensis TaxID=1084519 RepID=A0ABP8G0F7_9BACT
MHFHYCKYFLYIPVLILFSVKTSSILYLIASILIVIGLVLQLTHVISLTYFNYVAGASLMLGIMANGKRRQEIK